MLQNILIQNNSELLCRRSMLGEPNCKGEQMDSTCCFIARELNITAALAAQLAPCSRDTETALPQMILFRSCKKLISLAKTWQLTMDMPLQEHTNGKAHKHAQRDGGRVDIDNTETHTGQRDDCRIDTSNTKTQTLPTRRLSH